MAILHRKEKLIYTAIEVLNEFGIQDLSTKEIAKRQDISEAAIFKHFSTKNELILGILAHYSQYDADIIVSSRERMADPMEAISYFIKAYAEYYENYPAITAITQAYDFFSAHHELADKIRDIYQTRSNFIREMIDEAEKLGRLILGTDSDMLTDIIRGMFNAICLRWRLFGFNFPLKEYTLSSLKMLLDAFFIN